MRQKRNTEVMVLRVPESIRYEFEAKANDEGLNMSEKLRDLVITYLEEPKKPKRKIHIRTSNDYKIEEGE